MNFCFKSKKTAFAILGMVSLSAMLFTSCKKNNVKPNITRYDVSAQIDVNNTQSASNAKGVLTAEYLTSTKQLSYNIAYSSDIEVDQIELCYGTPAGLGKVIAILEKSGQKHASPLKGSIKLDDNANSALLQKGLYINIKSFKSPLGEIRGQLVVKNLGSI